jgi:hypothetical protein
MEEVKEEENGREETGEAGSARLSWPT